MQDEHTRQVINRLRSIEGHGFNSTPRPFSPGLAGLPSWSRTSALMPGRGRVAEPGFRLVMGSGAVTGELIEMAGEAAEHLVYPQPVFDPDSTEPAVPPAST